MAYRVINMAEDPRSGQFAYFRAMADPWAGITVPVDITAFYNALDGRPFFLSFLYALTRAANAGVPAETVSPKRCGGQAAFESALSDLLAAHEIDLIVLAGFLTILSADFTARWPSRILNVHPSLIPAFCGKGMYGLKVHEAALAKGVKVTGATVHFVNEIPDGGEILLQKAVEVLPDDTPETLQRRVMEQAEWLLLPRAAELVSEQIVKEKSNA